VAHVLLFHHALGLTDGVRAFADDLRAAGHEVTVPDLYDGARFASIEEGVAHAEQLGFEAIAERGTQLAEQLPAGLVYAGLSLGVMPAQRTAQVRTGARGAILYHGGLPIETFGASWPDGVPLQLHVMEDDAWGDVDDVRQLAVDADAELFTYPGAAHLFTDRHLDAYDADATSLVLERTLDLLGRIDRAG
jgi:dienelactone hydrolase